LPSFPTRRSSDLVAPGRVLAPSRHRAHVVFGDEIAVAVAKDVFQEDANGKGKLRNGSQPGLFQSVEAVDHRFAHLRIQSRAGVEKSFASVAHPSASLTASTLPRIPLYTIHLGVAFRRPGGAGPYGGGHGVRRAALSREAHPSSSWRGRTRRRTAASAAAATAAPDRNMRRRPAPCTRPKAGGPRATPKNRTVP